MIYNTAVAISILALSLKIVTLIQLRGLLRQASVYALVPIMAFVGINIIELIGFFLTTSPDQQFAASVGLVFLLLYYALLLTALFSLLVLALLNTGWPGKWWWSPVTIAFTIAQLVTLIPGLGIDGIQNIGYSGSRIPGKFYFIVQAGLIIPALLTPILSIVNIQKGCAEQRYLGYLHLFCFAPIVATVATVVLIMQLGYRVNASAALSLAVCLPVWLLLFTHSNENIAKYLKYLPWSKEFRRARYYSDLQELAKHNLSSTYGLNLKELLKEIERSSICEALAQSNGNKTEAAKLLSVSRSTVSKKAAEYEIGD